MVKRKVFRVGGIIHHFIEHKNFPVSKKIIPHLFLVLFPTFTAIIPPFFGKLTAFLPYF
jgi:hypothetical protein